MTRPDDAAPTAGTGGGQEELTGLAGYPKWVRRLLLVLCTAVFVGLLSLIHVPAALMIGAMVGSIVVAVRGARLSMPPRIYLAAQVVIGCLISNSINAQALIDFGHRWPLMVTMVLAVIVVATALGYILARMQVLPGTSALWGCAPGAASAMVVMSEEFGEDMRLVAFMQYTRVLMVAGLASIISTIVVHATGRGDSVNMFANIFAPVDWKNLALTLIAAAAGGAIAVRLKVPSGAMLGPLVLVTTLKLMGVLEVVLPIWLLGPAYLVLGWKIGLGFTRTVLRHAGRALPKILLSTALLLFLCGLMALALVHFLGIDPLTAYLATSPGGADSIAIISASSDVDVPFVMSTQVARLLIVMALGPVIARAVAKRLQV